MKQNSFSLFLQKVEEFPMWIKQAICLKLSEGIKAEVCEKFLEENSDDIFSLYRPILTFKGKEEIKNHKTGLDLNLYNFLSSCENDLTIMDISLNTFLSMEEVSKYFILCVEQGFVERPENIEIEAMAGFLAGKFRTGEYFAKKGVISDEQVQQAVDAQTKSSKKFAEILVDMGFITKEDVNAMLSFKEGAQRRFILDYTDVPKGREEFSDKEEEYKKVIEDLKAENESLKKKISQLLEIVRRYD